MSQSRILLVLLALVALAGVGGWLILNDSGAAAPTQPLSHALAHEQPVRNPITSHENPQPAQPAGRATDPVDQPEAPTVEAQQPTRRTESPDSAQQEEITDTDRRRAEQARAQQLTAAQREELRREQHGRPALTVRMGRTPSASRTAGTQRKSVTQKEWDEQWSREGFKPPPMVPTPVQGKVMSEQAREGLAKAIVHLMTFFPIDGVAGGPLLPVITDLTADGGGNFKGEVPVSPQAPLNFPLGAIGVSWQGKRVLTGRPLAILEPGKQNGLGVFWAPDAPFTLTCDAAQFTGNLRVASTGLINPQRIHRAKQIGFINSFPIAAVVPREAEVMQGAPVPGTAELSGTWDLVLANLPYVSLFDQSSLIQTRRTAMRQTMSKAGWQAEPSPFQTLVFEQSSLLPIGGQVVDSSGAPVSGAVLTTIGGDIAHTAVTDFSGWFTIDEPHEATTTLRVQHDEFAESLTPAKPGDTDLMITMAKRRPRIRFVVTDKYTFGPITELSFKVVGIHPHGKNKGKNMPPQVVSLNAVDGRYTLEWETDIRNVTLEKLGYFPRLFNNPVKVAGQSDGEISVKLAPSRNLEVTPRDYTSVQDTSRWFKDPQNGPGIYTAWSHHWIEWEVDFGEEPEEGEQGGFFDMVLGCTNHGIVDNEYRFNVDVYVDEKRRGALSIQADSLTIREGRLRLGALSGLHRIRLVWTNDKWIPNQLDANIRYATLKFIEQPK